MAFKKSGNKNIKIVAATSMVIFSLFTCFSAAYAWFLSLKSSKNEADHFVIRKSDTGVKAIKVYNYYGLLDGGTTFGFDHTPNHEITWDEEGGTDSTGFQMGQYSIDLPHHPVLFLMELTGDNVCTKLFTEYPYLAKDKPNPSATTYGTYAALNASLGSLVEGNYYSVTNDEHQSATYYDEGTSSNKKVSSQYQVVDGKLVLKWVDIGLDDNPLSSIIQTHYLLFTDDPTDNSGTDRYTYSASGDYFLTSGLVEEGVTYYTRSGDYPSYTYTEDTSLIVGRDLGTIHYIKKNYYLAVPESSLTDGNKSCFVSFDNLETPVFDAEPVLYSGAPGNYKYLGIVFDYNIESLEYIYSYYLGRAIMSNDLDFKCDWMMEI